MTTYLRWFHLPLLFLICRLVLRFHLLWWFYSSVLAFWIPIMVVLARAEESCSPKHLRGTRLGKQTKIKSSPSLGLIRDSPQYKVHSQNQWLLNTSLTRLLLSRILELQFPSTPAMMTWADGGCSPSTGLHLGKVVLGWPLVLRQNINHIRQ